MSAPTPPAAAAPELNIASFLPRSAAEFPGRDAVMTARRGGR